MRTIMLAGAACSLLVAVGCSEKPADDSRPTTGQTADTKPAPAPETADGHGHSTTVPGAPTKVVDDDEKTLYLTPGGKYTEADITANGGVTASQKFKGFKAAHDLKPAAGDQICPVTLTRANPKVSWVIGGKTYEFCCPPCVDEFVALAKEKPDEINDPASYVKK